MVFSNCMFDLAMSSQIKSVTDSLLFTGKAKVILQQPFGTDERALNCGVDGFLTA